MQAVPCEASRARKRVGFAMLCREIKSEAVSAAGDTSQTSRVVLEVLQAAKVAAPAPAPDGTEPVPRDLAVFDHGDLADPERAEALRLIFVRWEGTDGLGGCVAGPRRRGRARRFSSAGRPANGANEAEDDEGTMSARAPREPQTAFAAVLPRRGEGTSRRDKKNASLFGHVPDGATVRVRRMRVPGLRGASASAGGCSLDASVPRETCELRIASASERGARRPETLVALERLTPAEDADEGDADDGWLGAETRCVFEPAGGVDEPADATLESARADAPVPDPKARTTKVVFHYLYHRGKLRKTESTVGMTCPLCLHDADNFDALGLHMDACHGRFKFAFFPGGDVAPRRGNIGRPPKNAKSGDDAENASNSSAPLVTLIVPRPGPADPAVHVMCREEDENAREQAEQDEWEWFHEHGGWYTGNRARRERFLEPPEPPKSDAADASKKNASGARAASEPPSEPGASRGARAAIPAIHGATVPEEPRPTPSAPGEGVGASAGPEGAPAPAPAAAAPPLEELVSPVGGAVPAGAVVPGAPTRKEMLPTYAVKQFVFASRRYPLRAEARAALAAAHREEVARARALRRAEEEALVKARHRAKRVEAQTNRRRREREEQLARDESRLREHSAQHQIHRRLLLQLAKHREAAAVAARLDPRRALEGVSGMAHLGNLGLYPGFIQNPGGGLGGLAGLAGVPAGIPRGVPGIPGGVGFVPERGYSEEILRQMRVRELQANERLLRLEIERVTAEQNARGGATLAVAEQARRHALQPHATRYPRNDDDDDDDDAPVASASPFADRDAAMSLLATAATAARARQSRAEPPPPQAGQAGQVGQVGQVGPGPGAKEKRPLSDAAGPSSKEKRHKSRGDDPKGGVSVDAIIAKINRDLAVRAAEGSKALETEPLPSREGTDAAAGKRRAREDEPNEVFARKPSKDPVAGPGHVGAARKGKANAKSAAAEGKNVAGAKETLPSSSNANATGMKSDKNAASRDGHGVAPPGTAYHARTAMPMAREPGDEFGPARDSDDEEDALQWALEDYRRLVDFTDVQREEKVFMHEWNAFVKQFRPVGDRALPAALEAFAHYRGEAMSRSKTFKRLFALHLLNAFEFGVIPAGTIDACMRVVESYGLGKGAARRVVPGIGGAVGIPGIGDVPDGGVPGTSGARKP